MLLSLPILSGIFPFYNTEHKKKLDIGGLAHKPQKEKKSLYLTKTFDEDSPKLIFTEIEHQQDCA